MSLRIVITASRDYAATSLVRISYSHSIMTKAELASCNRSSLGCAVGCAVKLSLLRARPPSRAGNFSMILSFSCRDETPGPAANYVLFMPRSGLAAGVAGLSAPEKRSNWSCKAHVCDPSTLHRHNPGPWKRSIRGVCLWQTPFAVIEQDVNGGI